MPNEDGAQALVDPCAFAASATLAVISCRPWPVVSTWSCLTIGARFERGHRGELLAFQELEERAAGGGDVVDRLSTLNLWIAATVSPPPAIE